MKKKAASPKRPGATALQPRTRKRVAQSAETGAPAIVDEAAYGERILATVSRELTAEFGGGFGYATVNRAIQFAQFFPDPAIVSALSTQLSGSHFIELLPIKDPPAREFYKDFLSVHGERAHRRERAGIVAEVVA